jgi:hypothetical protein
MRVGSVRSVSNTETSTDAGRWYRQPLVWFGGLVFAALLAGTAVTVIVATRFGDQSLPAGNIRVLATPIDRSAPDGSAPDQAPDSSHKESSARQKAPR